MFYPMKRTALALPLALAIAGGVYAQQQGQQQRSGRADQQPQEQRTQQQQQQQRQQQGQERQQQGQERQQYDTTGAQARAGFESQLIRANQLIGMDVQNRQGEELGQIEEIILNESQDRVQYVVLSFGGWLNIGDKLFAVPFQAFEFRPGRGEGRDREQGMAILDVSRERLRNAPGFDPDRYPDVANPDFAQDVEQFYGQRQQRQYGQAADGQRTNRDRDRDRDRDTGRGRIWDLGADAGGDHWSQDWRTWRLRALSRVIGSDVEDPEEWNITDVEDLVIDQREGRLVYAILSYGGTLGVNQKQAVVPWRALNAQVEDGQYTLNIPRDRAVRTLDAVALERDVELSDAQFGERVHRQFNAQPYWEIYGYSRGQGQGDASVGWRAEDEFLRNYNAQESRRITGRVESVGTFYPTQDRTSTSGLRLRIRTEDGQTMTVFAGPEAHARASGVRFYNGDRITVTGSEATIDGRRGIIAREIRSGDQTLRLLDERGRPMWNAADLRDRSGERHYLNQGQQRGDSDRRGRMDDRDRRSRDRYESDVDYRSDSRSRYESDRNRSESYGRERDNASHDDRARYDRERDDRYDRDRRYDRSRDDRYAD